MNESTVVVARSRSSKTTGDLVALNVKTPVSTENAVQAATLRLLDALERRALKPSRRVNGKSKAVLEEENEDFDALPAGMPTLLLSEIAWGGPDTDAIEDRLYSVVNTAADTLVTQMSGQQFDGLCLAIAGNLFNESVGACMMDGEEEHISESVTHLVDVLEGAVRFLAEHFAEVFIPCVPANGWLHPASASPGVATLLDRLAYQMLRARIGDLIELGRVQVEIAEEGQLSYALYGTTYLLRACGEGVARPSAAVSAPTVVHGADVAAKGCDYVVTGNVGTPPQVGGFILNGSMNARNGQQALWVTHPVQGVSALFSIFGEPRAAESSLPAYRTFKPTVQGAVQRCA
jgi:hypothetical protein